jgi:Zn-dependent protease with chaperone function
LGADEKSGARLGFASLQTRRKITPPEGGERNALCFTSPDMNREEFDALVGQLERRAGQNPGRFRWRVGALAVMGYSYLLLVLGGSLALTIGIVCLVVLAPNALTIKLGIIFGVLTGGLSWAILRGLFVRLEAPTGLAIRSSEAPELFLAIEELRARLGAPRFHHVLLTPEHNAGVVQIPRLGVFGWHCNYLLLGLPLLQGVSVEEFRAILAHEFAHLSGAHGKFGAWIYRLRRAWERVFDQLGRQKQGSWVLGKFLEWFWPKFNGHAFVLSRVQEYEADAIAARLTSSRALATGLIRTQVQGRWLDEKFWPDFYNRTREVSTPPATLFSELGSGIRQLHAVPDSHRWLAQAYNFETDNSDTHPCLKDRLSALPGLPADIPPKQPPVAIPVPPSLDAATALFGSSIDVLTQKITDQFTKQIGPKWKERHEETRKLSEEITKLESAAVTEEAGSGNVGQLWKRVELILDRDGIAAAQPLVEQVLVLDPDHAGANFARGRHLLENDDPLGIDHLERTIAKDRLATLAACDLMYGYYARTGQRDRLRGLEQRADAYRDEHHLAERERANATERDTFLEPELTAEESESLRAAVREHPEIVAVHVARKRVQHFPETPMFVIALTIRRPWWKPVSSAANQKLVDRLIGKISLRGNWLVFAVEQNLRGLGKCVRKVGGSLLYEKSGS